MIKNLRTHIAMLIVLSASVPAYGLDILGRSQSEGGHGTRRGLQVLYRFQPTVNNVAVPANTVVDESGVGSPLNLTLSSTTAIQRSCNRSVFDPATGQSRSLCYLDFVDGTNNAAKSPVASKVINACRTSGELTVEMWVRNDRADELTKSGLMMPIKILTLGRGSPETINNRYVGSSNDSNFFLGLTYDNAAQYAASVRRGARDPRQATIQDGFTGSDAENQARRYEIEQGHTMLTSLDTPEQKILFNDKLQHVVYTVNRQGLSRLYVSSISSGDAGNEDPFSLVPVLRDSANQQTSFAQWNTTNAILSLGNEATHGDRNAPIYASDSGAGTVRTERRPFRGELYMVAIYCEAHTEEEILGNASPTVAYRSYAPNPLVQVTATHEKAAKLYTRLTGVRIPVTAPIISGVNDPRYPDENYAGQGMVQLIDNDNALGAALLATNQKGFFNITVRDFAKRMSTRDESVNTPLNDFVATVIGTVRDNIPATQLLTGNYFYMADPRLAAAPNNMLTDILKSNNHYDRLEAQGYDLHRVLMKVEGQKATNGTGVTEHPEPAGVLTSRAFLGAHAIAGTNRRIIEYTFQEFLCVPITAWSDSTGPDNRVGMDVDRYPAGDHTKFLSTCRSCHSNMDGFRGAFAKFNFNNNYVKHADVVTPTNDPDESETTMWQDPVGIAGKMNRNSDMFPGGFRTTNNSWVNNATRGTNATIFGWTATTESSGVNRFGQLIASSKAFPSCMAKRAFRAVCKRNPGLGDQGFIDSAAQAFVNENYNLKNLFARVSVSRECIGDGL